MADPIITSVDEELDVFMSFPHAGTSNFRPTTQYLVSNHKIRVYVGGLGERRVWTLEEDIFRSNSEFLNTRFQEEPHTSSKTLLLEDEDPIAFGWFVDWVYTGGLHLEAGSVLLLISLFGLSEKLRAEEFLLEVLDKFTEQLVEASKLPSLEEAALLYQNTSPKSRPRQLFVNHFVEKVFSIPSRIFAEQDADWNMALSWDDFRFDVMIAIKRQCRRPSERGTAASLGQGVQHQRKRARRGPVESQKMEDEGVEEEEDLEAGSLVIRHR